MMTCRGASLTRSLQIGFHRGVFVLRSAASTEIENVEFALESLFVSPPAFDHSQSIGVRRYANEEPLLGPEDRFDSVRMHVRRKLCINDFRGTCSWFSPRTRPALMESLRSFQDFLSSDSLWCFWLWGRSRSLNPLNCEERLAIVRPCVRRDADFLSNDLLPCLCLLRLRPISMDARHEAEGDNSPRNGYRCR
jgi:hypothetical protein